MRTHPLESNVHVHPILPPSRQTWFEYLWMRLASRAVPPREKNQELVCVSQAEIWRASKDLCCRIVVACEQFGLERHRPQDGKRIVNSS
ncbi:unnamed protein product [Periconia digitata]|uniref:Uncharacterized protein n=1 Tax=Periconia digitata TaxID=1303443 RepID=A0A9W4XSI6_9PLEO|nr:unnamed protein product [Periconia digitata]